MTINMYIEGEPQEIAALALELQGRRAERLTVDLSDASVSQTLYQPLRAAAQDSAAPEEEPDPEEDAEESQWADSEGVDLLGKQFRPPNDWTSSMLRILTNDAVRLRHAIITIFVLNAAAIAIGATLLLLRAVR